MWALLDKDNETVIGCYTPDIPYETVVRESEEAGLQVVLMTLENSPAYIPGKYINGKFYKEGENPND